MKRRWYRDLDPVTCAIPTGDGKHRVSWRRGRIVLHDHDLEAEQVLRALGGEACTCLLMLDLFRDGSGGLFAYSRSRRALSTAFNVSSARAIPTGSWAAGPIPSGLRPMHVGNAHQTLRRVRTDPGFQRLPADHREQLLRQLRQQVAVEMVPDAMLAVLDAIRALRADRGRVRADDAGARPDFEAVLRSLAVPALEEGMRRWRRDLRPYAPLNINCWRRKPAEAMVLQGDLTSTSGRLAISLSTGWLNRVGVRGLACVDGCFILEVDQAAPATALMGQAVRWERRAGDHSVPVVAPCFIARRGGRWCLSW